VWSIAKVKMLLHDIKTADLLNDETLSEPRHAQGGELMRFDRVLSNPPFSINWGTTGTDRAGQSVWAAKYRAERFRCGEVPLGSKKADLMFLQHMVFSVVVSWQESCVCFCHTRRTRREHVPRGAT
jgi:type I restriction enzyme M protein